MKKPFRKTLTWLVLGAVVVVAALAATQAQWLPAAKRLVADRSQSADDDHSGHDHAADDHSGHDHGADDSSCDDHPAADHSGHDEATVLILSDQALRNVGLRTTTIVLRAFDRTVTLPAMIVERPGRTCIRVSAPMAGIVVRIYPIRGEAVSPGQPLFDLRLTHEDLVATQSQFLQTVEQIDVINREVTRLEKVTASGAIAGKALLERQYELQKTEASFRAQQQALILHGLSQQQVDAIVETRKLLQQLTVFAPEPAEEAKNGDEQHPLQVSVVNVERGQYVDVGESLCLLADHAQLYVEGKAFEEDASELNEAANRGTPVTAIIEGNGKTHHSVSDLTILYVENEIERESRALRFYVRLPNELVRNEETADGHRFIGWRYKPGQRVELRVPVERWNERIVLPVDSVVREGAENFVFEKNGDHFHRQSVHVEYRDQRWVVLDTKDSLQAGDVVVTSGAYQMYLDMKKKEGGGVDPHAGHNH